MTIAAKIDSILIVEDSELQRMAMAELCRSMNFPIVYEAGNGEEALAILAGLESPPTVALVDLEMPVMNGIGLFKRMYEQNCSIPIIIVSTQDSTTMDAALSLLDRMGIPCWGIARKPVDSAELQKLLVSQSG